MDPATLVREKKTAGEVLIRRLLECGFDIQGAAWTQLDGDSRSYLYFVSAEVQDRDTNVAYAKLGATQKALLEGGPRSELDLDPFDIKLIPPTHPLGSGILSLNRRFPDHQPTYHHGTVLGSVYVDGAYIYPAKLFAPPPVAVS